jgi:hypothetical protein
MSQVKSSYDIMSGTDDLFNTSSALPIVQPLQMIPFKLKDEKWMRQNVDYIEWQGLLQIKEKAKRLLKNYNLSAGILNKSDYIVENFEDDERDVASIIIDEDNPLPDAMELQFYPLIPTYIETLTNEYSKRGTSKIDYRAVDEISVNEIISKKQLEIEKVLLEYGQKKMTAELVEAGYPLDDPEVMKQLELPNLKEKLPEINDFYKKDYRTTFEIWATKMHKIDEHRFKMGELERESFADYLKTDSSFWYIEMKENDYNVKLLNPITSFKHTSPNIPWISDGNYAGFIDVVSVADAIDIDGELMTEEEMRGLENMLPANVDANYKILDEVSVGSSWNAEESYEKNRSMGVDMRRLLTSIDFNSRAGDVIDYIIGQTEDKMLMHNTGMLRRTTLFWKTQRKIGIVFEIKENNETDLYHVDENFVQQINPVYNTKFRDLRNAETLVYGQHVDWIWINEVWGAKKYSGSHATFTSINGDSSTDALYLGVGRKKPGPLPFQFKSDINKWGNKLPIEGRNFTDRNTISRSAVDLLKPAQILFNIANNQLTDILSDETGPVVALDQNTIPKHSIDGSWGANNYMKARGVMNEYNLLVLDNSMGNTESPTNTNHVQVLDMSQTNRLLSRLNISRYAKELANDVMGFSPQRSGQQIGVTSKTGPTATEVEQSQVGSYNRTETYFINHADHLMPRVHEMRTAAAQYYYSKQPSFVLKLMISPDERALFEINGTELLMRDAQVFTDNSSSRRAMLNNIMTWVLNNNTNGAGILDVPELMQTDSLAQLNFALKKVEERQQKQSEMLHAREMEKIEKQNELEQAAIDKQNNFKALQNMMDRQIKLLSEQIRASGYAAMQDLNQNSQSDQLDLIKNAQEQQVYQDTMNIKRDEISLEKDKIMDDKHIALRKIEADVIKSNNNLSIAKQNKNKYDN